MRVNTYTERCTVASSCLCQSAKKPRALYTCIAQLGYLLSYCNLVFVQNRDRATDRNDQKGSTTSTQLESSLATKRGSERKRAREQISHRAKSFILKSSTMYLSLWTSVNGLLVCMLMFYVLAKHICVWNFSLTERTRMKNPKRKKHTIMRTLWIL